MPTSLSILILGGTGFIGPHQVAYALDRGHRVTLFHRQRRAAPSGVEELTGDRENNDYRSLRGRSFDVCIDNPASVPHWVRDAAVALKGSVDRYIFISTLSVYAAETPPGADESAPRARYAGADAMAETLQDLRKDLALYAPLKAKSEDEVCSRFGNAIAIVRPGLIVGPGDRSDRFTYWPVRLAHGGKVLVPPLHDPVQFIDVRDLAEWTIRLAEQRTFGEFNAIGPRHELSFGAMLEGIRAVITDRAELCEAPPAFLERHRVEPWSDLPVWIPGQGDTAGFHRRSNARAIAAGLTFRPLETTAADTLAWWNRQPVERKARLCAGLKPEREAELVELLRTWQDREPLPPTVL
jgi:2'-hydroxyisoflavone reductase